MAFSCSEMASGPVEGIRARVWRITAVLVVLVAGLTLAGCYEVEEEVIPASLAEVIPYTSDRADLDTGGHLTLSRSSFNNDYRFRKVSKEGDEDLGAFRAMRIKDNIYAVQVRLDYESNYTILFYSITANRFDPMDIAGGTDLKTFAGRYGAEYEDSDFSEGYFSGDREKILAMLRGLSEVEFKVQQ